MELHIKFDLEERDRGDKLQLWAAVEGNLRVCGVMFVEVFETDACNSPPWHMTHPLPPVGVRDSEGCTKQTVLANAEKPWLSKEHCF
jgi:hypothetical protein